MSTLPMPVSTRSASRVLDRLGRGWAFPVRPTANGQMPFAVGAGVVERSIFLILETEPGERVMRPEFGCGLRRFIMEPNSVALRAMIQAEVERALSDWEPRITLERVQVDPGDDPSLVLIEVEYFHVRDRRPGNFVYPLYLE